MVTIINIADIKDPDDPDGRSYREVNHAKKHAIKVGQLVELDDGVRLWVVMQTRDCDGTPLYTLCHDKNDTIQGEGFFANIKWIHGYSDGGLVVVGDSGDVK